MIPQEYIQEVVARNDITEVIGQYVQLRHRGRTYTGLCPFHNEKTPSFTVYPDTQSFYCFGCGAAGDVINFVRKISNLGYVEAVKQLAGRAGMPMPEEDDQESRSRSRLLEINRNAARYFYDQLNAPTPEAAMARRYWREKRGLSDAAIRRFGLGYAPEDFVGLLHYLRHRGFTEPELESSGLVKRSAKGNLYDIFRHRVMVPIIDVRGNIIAFGEGYMDVISMHEAGFDTAVCACGTALTPEQVKLLTEYADEVVLSYDSDEAGQKATERSLALFSGTNLQVRVLNIPGAKDPDEFIKTLGAEKFQERIDQAENSFLFEIRMLEQNYDMNDPESKTAFYNETARRLLAFPEELERNNYIQAVADKYRIGFEDLRKLVNNLAMAGSGITKAAPLKSGIHEKKKEDGMKQSQKLLLTWLIEDTRLFDSIKGWITEEDFTEPLYRKAAQELFTQYGESGQVNPAKIISRFQEEEEQKEIAGLFNAKIHEVETKQDKEKALKETIERIKENSIDVRSRQSDPNDLTVVMQLINEQKELEKLKKTHISID